MNCQNASMCEANANALLRAAGENDRLREALAFYAEPENWRPQRVRVANGPNAGAEEWQSAETEIDRGDTARLALAALPRRVGR